MRPTTSSDHPAPAPPAARPLPSPRGMYAALLRADASYDDLARAVGVPRGSRAVGRANGRYRIAIVIPCHCVGNKTGELGGYGGGVWRKRALLALEQRAR